MRLAEPSIPCRWIPTPSNNLSASRTRRPGVSLGPNARRFPGPFVLDGLEGYPLR